MKVYIVQKRHWEYDDQYMVLEDTIPVKAFESKQDAEAFRALQELSEREDWLLEKTLFLGEDGPRPASEYPLFEVVETELVP
jgi:hypothetical protein